ncbi:hypothetical protein [Deinococcus marmoris]|uniref:Holliday junction resolvasome, helicase subunit n=1 Tax=Deinococcus marmoris TaxID=249408 RepID=A0A1U7NYM6_9DEIO|nr:hypothetical protein [Deinococcus marmoris]OLV18019.1 Holliday junction resolvasome, helicase subunit [Deinococcus marmoris]
MGYLFHLVGPPGSGKRTIGLKLSALTGAVLLDNPLFNDAVFRPYGADGLRSIPEEIHVLATQVRKLGLEAARLAPRDVSQIFTSYLTNRPSGPAALQLVRNLAAARDVRYIPVWLECDVEELERRLSLPERLERAKLRDPAILRETLRTSGMLSAPPDAIRIDTLALAPADAARLIAEHSGALF